jgi:poly(hydroxyalkanoate) depolymerase family esterase
MASLRDMLDATALVRGGRLTEATRLISDKLRASAKSSAKPGAPTSASASDSAVIDLARSAKTGIFEFPTPPMERTSSQTEKAERHAQRNAKGIFEARPSFLRVVRDKNRPDVNIPDGASFEERSCHCPQGDLAYKLYVPSGYVGQPLPLLVMLHGCTQSPDDFAAGTRMNIAAEEHNVLVAYPAQSQSANVSKCWNWFRAADQRRGAGEPAMIAAATLQIAKQYSVQRHRIFVAGLSAGGAAAAVLGAAYPDIYAAIGVHSGLACGAARDLSSAMAAMKTGGSPSAIIDGQSAARPVRTIVFHGDRDNTVNPINGERVFDQFKGKGASLTSEVFEARSPGGLDYTRTIFKGESGAPIFEKWVIHGAGHAWSGGSASGSYTEPRGPDASQEMLRFFLADG